MKFISKSSNLLIVLKPGMPAQHLTGTPATPTVSVRFKDGVAEVPDGELLDRMLAHPSFNGDFVSAEATAGKDPYASSRAESEPRHDITELKFGTPVSRIAEPKKLSPEMQKVIQEAAISLAKEMLPSMIKESLKGILEAHEASKKGLSKGKKKGGRPKKVVAVEKAVEKEEVSEEAKPPVEEAPIV